MKTVSPLDPHSLMARRNPAYILIGLTYNTEDQSRSNTSAY